MADVSAEDGRFRGKSPGAHVRWSAGWVAARIAITSTRAAYRPHVDGGAEHADFHAAGHLHGHFPSREIL